MERPKQTGWDVCRARLNVTDIGRLARIKTGASVRRRTEDRLHRQSDRELITHHNRTMFIFRLGKLRVPPPYIVEVGRLRRVGNNRRVL
jgi:hypothetical protein